VYQAPPVVYAAAPPTIIYTQPAYYYGSPYYYPYYYSYPRGYYSNSVVIGAATIRAAGRVAAAVIETSRFHDDHRNVRVVQNVGRRR
jgi:hypothetical protein